MVYFDHQEPETFAAEVDKLVAQETKTKKKARKFLIVEGVSWKTGKILPLPAFLKIAENNKIRVFLEESYSIGVLGDKGQGLMEYFDIDPWRLDMIIATLEAAIGSIGGFCAGKCERFLCICCQNYDFPRLAQDNRTSKTIRQRLYFLCFPSNIPSASLHRIN